MWNLELIKAPFSYLDRRLDDPVTPQDFTQILLGMVLLHGRAHGENGVLKGEMGLVRVDLIVLEVNRLSILEKKKKKEELQLRKIRRRCDDVIWCQVGIMTFFFFF